MKARRAARLRGRGRKRGVTWAMVRKLAFALPGMEDGTCYGTPALYVRRKFLVRLKEDGETIAIKTDFADREVLMQLDPEAFFITGHYLAYPMMLVRLGKVRLEPLRELLEQAWRRAAPRSLLNRSAKR